jgi:Uncharacterized conserved protein (DUF2190)
MAQPNQLANKDLLPIAVYNGSGSTITEGYAVALDASYPPATWGAPGVKLTTGATDCIGFAKANILTGKYGFVQCAGIARAIAGGTITFGSTLAVMTDSAGKVVAKTSGQRVIGVPLSTAASGDEVLVLMGAGVDNA